MFVGEVWLGFAGVLGLVVSTATAMAIGLDRGAIRVGLFGFNGVLVGAGMSLFLQPDWDLLVMVWIVLGAALSSVLHAALAAVFLGAWKVPPFTLAFNFITLMFLIGALNYANGRVGGLIAPADAQVTRGDVSNTLRSAADAATANNIEGIVNAIMRGISQLFFANSIVSGILIIVGIAVASRIAAVFALVGSTVGMLTGLAVGASGVAIYNGLWGFNSFDAALAVGGVFFVLNVDVGHARGGLRRPRRAAVRSDRHAVRAVGPAGPHAAVRLRHADLRPAQGDHPEARGDRGRGHHDARGAPDAQPG